MIILGVMPTRSIHMYERSFSRFGSPHPGLLSTKQIPALVTISGLHTGVSDLTFGDVDDKHPALRLEEGTSVYISGVGVKSRNKSFSPYVIDLAFVVRLGLNISLSDAAETFDATVAYYIKVNDKFSIPYV